MKSFSVLAFLFLTMVGISLVLASPWATMAESEGDAAQKEETPAPAGSVAMIDPPAEEKTFMKMVRIGNGTFTMGSHGKDTDEHKAEMGHESGESVHQVTISKPFFIGAYEVTQGQFNQIMEKNPSTFSDCGASCPVETVTFFEAVEFCNRLSEKEGLTACYSQKVEEDESVEETDENMVVEWTNDMTWSKECTGYRLPTEAEWEFAARAGSKTPYYTGECMNTDQANFDGTDRHGPCAKGIFRQKTMPVGSFAANNWGLYDVLGNVNEWTWDWFYKSLSGNAVTDPSNDVADALKRTIRGGSWNGYMVTCRTARRFGEFPEKALKYNGFRVARSVK